MLEQTARVSRQARGLWTYFKIVVISITSWDFGFFVVVLELCC
jgi:hypothetical protein